MNFTQHQTKITIFVQHFEGSFNESRNDCATARLGFVDLSYTVSCGYFGMKKEKSEVVSATTQLKLLADDGKRYFTDMLD